MTDQRRTAPHVRYSVRHMSNQGAEPRARRGLTDTTIASAKIKRHRYKIADREGLYVAVMPTGKKVFRYEYRFHGRRETLTFGTYAKVGGMTLAEAREEHAKARRMVEKGDSPAEAARRAAAAAAFKLGTHFKGVAEHWVAQFSTKRSPSWRRVMDRFLEKDIYPVIGGHALSEITEADVIAAAKRAQDRGSHYTAAWVRRTIAAVFNYAMSRGLTERNPARAARGAIEAPRPENKAALRPTEIRDVVLAIRKDGGRPGTRIALELLLHTFVRKSELTQASWGELDLDSAEWRIPAHRMKMREEHVVPLSRQSIALFREARRHSSGSGFVFPGLTTLTKPLSDTALNNALNRMGYNHISPHTFRRTASTMLNEKGWRPDVIERQLAHSERNRMRAAYNKATYLPERIKMMQDWSDHVTAIVSGSKVVTIGGGARSA